VSSHQSVQCPNGHDVTPAQSFCSVCGAVLNGSAQVGASDKIKRPRKLWVVASLVLVALITAGIVVWLVTRPSEEAGSGESGGITREQLIQRACAGEATYEGAPSGMVADYHCDNYTTIYMFQTPADLQVFASSHDCPSTGLAVAGPDWLAVGITDPARASSLVSLGGTTVC
jgi:hypothetical protein